MGIVVQVISNVSGKAETMGEAKIFDKDQVTLGRAASNDLVLTAPDVSGRHAMLSVARDNGKPKILISDLGSSNGTYVEEKRLQPNTPVAITENQRVVVGGSFLLVVTLKGEKAEKKKEAKPDAPKSAEKPAPREPANAA